MIKHTGRLHYQSLYNSNFIGLCSYSYYNSHCTKQGHVYPGWFPALVESYKCRDLHGDAAPAAEI